MSLTQVTWGPAPLHMSETDDLNNQQRLCDLLRQAYFSDYREGSSQLHKLRPEIRAEIAEFKRKAQQAPWLALAVGMANYHFAWYLGATAEMDVAAVEDAADFTYASIEFSQCHRSDLTPEEFSQRMCSARWHYAVMLYSELGREYASQYLTDQAATALEKAVGAFDAMKRLPYYRSFPGWQSPYDINFNEEWFPGMEPSGPVWETSAVPLAQALEGSSKAIADELASILDRGLFDSLHFEGAKGEGQDHAPEGGWRAVELAAIKANEEPSRAWDTAACREAPSTCGLLRSRPELVGCAYAGAAFVRLQAGGSLKPQFGAAPKLTCQLALKADPGARISVGKRTLTWANGKTIVFDDTYIRQEWHAGVRGERYVLQVTFCHPCEESQRRYYAGSVSCPQVQEASAAFGGSPPERGSSTMAPAPPGTHPPAGGPLKQRPQDTVFNAPFAAAALWAATLPDLASCTAGISGLCPPDTQHGGPNPLSALNTWNYALNNLRLALRHTTIEVDPALTQAIAQVQEAIQNFLTSPVLDHFLPVVTTAAKIFEAVGPWLQQQPPALVQLAKLPEPENSAALPVAGATVSLGNGVEMPLVGFGTWKLEGTACYDAVRWALQAGIRHIDTAEAYANEADIGRALRDSGVPRSQLFLATKATRVALGMADPGQLEAILAAQLQALQSEYVDVYMLHAAGLKGEQLGQVWRAMERVYDLGRARALGVSNFGTAELEELWALARVKPKYLQNIFKVYKPGEQIMGADQESVVSWAKLHGMAVVGYSIINSWPQLLSPLQDPHVLAVARARRRTASQVLHRWALQHGVAVIPKASSQRRIQENAAIVDFTLSPVEMAMLDGLATLSETTHSELRPVWSKDVFGLVMAPEAGAFAEILRNRQCDRNMPDAQANPFTLGGGGHTLLRCQAECASQEACGFITFYHGTGYCHMFQSCREQVAAGDQAVIYARQ